MLGRFTVPVLRAAAQSLALAIPLAGCSAGAHATSPQSASQSAQARPTSKGDFANDGAKVLACLDLRDHIVDLYASQYVSQQGMVLTAAEQSAFKTGWGVELAKKGTFERFERSCFAGLTPRKYECAMTSKTPDGIVACMKLSSR